MSDREVINRYLESLSRYLSRLNAADAEDVLKEIESHIYDAIELAESKGEQADIEAILTGFGSSRELAEQYTRHMLDGTPPPAGFSAITSVKRGVTKSVFWATLAIGYGLGIALIVIAAVKLLVPESVGVWSTPHGESVIVGFVKHPPQNGEELLGMWLVPVFMVIGLLITRVTYVIQNAIKRLVV